MASLVSIAISNGINHVHCNWWWHHHLLSLVLIVPSSDAHRTFAAKCLLVYIKVNEGNYHSMINFFLLYCFNKWLTYWSWLGGVICCQLVQPIVANETFSYAVFFYNQAVLSKSDKHDFGGFVKIKKIIKDKLGSRSATLQGLGSTLLCLHKSCCSATPNLPETLSQWLLYVLWFSPHKRVWRKKVKREEYKFCRCH